MGLVSDMSTGFFFFNLQKIFCSNIGNYTRINGRYEKWTRMGIGGGGRSEVDTKYADMFSLRSKRIDKAKKDGVLLK